MGEKCKEAHNRVAAYEITQHKISEKGKLQSAILFFLLDILANHQKWVIGQQQPTYKSNRLS